MNCIWCIPIPDLREPLVKLCGKSISCAKVIYLVVRWSAMCGEAGMKTQFLDYEEDSLELLGGHCFIEYRVLDGYG